MKRRSENGYPRVGREGVFGLVFVAFMLVQELGCAAYREMPLERPAIAASPRPVDLPRLRVAVRDLNRAAAPPLELNLADGLDADEAAVLAVLLNRDLIAARDAHGETQAQILIAGILPNPLVDAGISHPFGPGSSQTVNAFNLSLSMELKAFVSRSARRGAAAAASDEVDLGIAWQEWQVAQEARLLVVRLGWLRKRIKLAGIELEFLTLATDATVQASATRDVTLEQVGVQRASLESARRALNELEQAEVETESALRALLGNPRLERLEVAEPVLSDPEQVDTEACLTGRLDLLALRRGYEAGEQQLRAAVLEQFPAVAVGVAYQRNETALNFIGGFVSVELPVFNRNQGMIRLGEASRRRLEHEYEARVASARADIERLSRFNAVLGRQLPVVQSSIPPLAEIELRERQAVLRGDVGRLSYQVVRSALFDQRLQEAVISQALAEARIGIQTTCGGDLRRQR